MSTNVSHKKQNFFKPVSIEADKTALFKSMLFAQVPLQIKKEGENIPSETNDLTMARVVDWRGMTVTAQYVSGPDLQAPCEATVVFELSRSMFFSTATLTQNSSEKLVLVFKGIYELQRRDAYRVTIPESHIRARLCLSKIKDEDSSLELRVADLSAGGLGLIAAEDEAQALSVGASLEGSLRIGGHQSVEIRAVVRHQRRLIVQRNVTFRVGCAFSEMSVSTNQKIAFLVNDCHRQSFSRISK